MQKKITLPLTDEVLGDLKAGDNVLLNGVIYVAREKNGRGFGKGAGFAIRYSGADGIFYGSLSG